MVYLILEYNNKKIINDINEKYKNWALDLIGVEHAWEKTKGEGVTVAILDSGINHDHKDLKGKIKNANALYDDYGHGTAVAGLIVGEKTGVAPNAKILSYKVLNNKGLGTTSDIYDGLMRAINSDVDIICMSIGTEKELPIPFESVFKKAEKKGIIVVSAIGNKGINYAEYPSYYDSVIGVSGIDESKNKSKFSNYSKSVDISAPSSNIISTHLSGNYAEYSGTSFASALIAGAIALMKSHFKNNDIILNKENIIELFRSINRNKNVDYGYGIIDLTKIIK